MQLPSCRLDHGLSCGRVSHERRVVTSEAISWLVIVGSKWGGFMHRGLNVTADNGVLVVNGVY